MRTVRTIRRIQEIRNLSMSADHMKKARVCAALLLSIFAAAESRAQVRGTARDVAQQPVAHALVELRRGTLVLQTTRTSSSGAFHFAAESLTSGLSLSARRIGYRPGYAEVTSTAKEIVISLEAFGQPLPEVLTVSGTTKCSRSDDAIGVAYLRSASARYRLPPDSLTLIWLAKMDSGEVEAASLGNFEEVLTGGRGRRGHGPQRIATSAALQRGEYAQMYRVPVHPEAADDEDGKRWRYTHIWEWAQEHFLTPSFLLHHTIGAFELRGRTAILTFCPKRKSGVALSGQLEFSSDSSLVRALFRYETPRPKEDFGVEILFVPGVKNAQGERVLSPSVAAVWQRSRTSRGKYLQWRYQYTTYEHFACESPRKCADVPELKPAIN